MPSSRKIIYTAEEDPEEESSGQAISKKVRKFLPDTEPLVAKPTCETPIVNHKKGVRRVGGRGG